MSSNSKINLGKNSNKDFPLVKVRWADHHVNYGDHDLGDIIKDARPLYGNYGGYLVYENKQVVIICSNWWEADGEDDNTIEVSDAMTIMKRAIVYRSDRDEDAST